MVNIFQEGITEMRKRSRSRSDWNGRRNVALNRKRRLAVQPLEPRHLLAGEGVGFDVSRTFTTAGLVGSLSSTVTWGDNTQSAGTVSGAVDNNGPLSIRFEYLGSFFNDPVRRAALENAATSVIERLGDDLTAISSSPGMNWTAVYTNPLDGTETRVPDMNVAANELVIFVGARDLPNLPKNELGQGGPGATEVSVNGNFTQAQVDAYVDNVLYRGETGAKATNPTDIGPWGGSIAFDSLTNWHFGTTTEGLESDEVDFSTVAVHELMHVLGFVPLIPSSFYTNYDAPTKSFTGPKATAANGGSIPLRSNFHVSDDVISDGQPSIVKASVDDGIRRNLTPLDVAILDDLGWVIRPTATATVTASHIYADNPDSGTTYPVEVVLRGSLLGEITQSLSSTVTNTPPTLSLPPDQSVQIGQAIAITNLGEISDPGFTSTAAGTTETFTYSINWGDGNTETGDATIDRNGSATATTLASFNGTHLYDAVGTYTVGVTATDDDGGSTSSSFKITVTPPPVLTLTVSNSNIKEDAGNNAATLTVARSGPALTTAQTIQLQSSDTGEATVAATVTIPANETSVTTPINAIDDALLDGTQTAVFTANGSGIISGEVSINVNDAESLAATFVGGNIIEADTTSVVLRITRSNTNIDDPLTVTITGGLPGQLTHERPAVINAGQQSVSLSLTPVQDDQPELTKTLNYVFTATGYSSATASVDVLDDEPPKFQNPVNRFNADGLGDVTPNDILTVINQLAEEGSDVVLNPETRALEGLFFDVDGNYILSPNDILEVINELARIFAENSNGGGGELIAPATPPQFFATWASPSAIDEDKDEALLRYLYDVASVS
ncbi:MAG: hypothetical protein WBD20_26525 [Pirellulaceae bacterium]